MDVAVHVGTLGAVFIYFIKDIKSMFTGGIKILQGSVDGGGQLVLQIAVATIPVVLFGFAVKSFHGELMRQLQIIGWTSILFGIILFAVDRCCKSKHTLASMSYKKAFIIGMVQALAVIPGTSRAGACMTGLRLLGFNRVDSAHFSCLMSIPTIIAAASLVCYDLCTAEEVIAVYDLSLAILFSFIFGWISIYGMMKLLKKVTFTPFVIYRVLLGCAILYFFS